MSPWLVVLLIGVGSYRITRLITEDSLLDGPRDWVLLRWPVETHKATALVGCPFCVSFWVCGALLGIAHLVGLVLWPLKFDLVIWWAVAGLASLAASVDGRLNA